MRYDSALPRSFPLVVKTPKARDVYIELRAQGSNRPVLSAYFRADTPMRVLVPPGIFRLRAYSGQSWQGEARLFGPDTRLYAPEEALEFSIAGLARKEGWVLDLNGPQKLREIAICDDYLPPQSDFQRGRGPISQRLHRREPAELDGSPNFERYKRICE